MNNENFKPFISPGHDLIFDFIENQKETKQLLKKYEKRLELYIHMLENLDAEKVLTTFIDEFGENFSINFVNNQKQILSENLIGS